MGFQQRWRRVHQSRYGRRQLIHNVKMLKAPGSGAFFRGSTLILIWLAFFLVAPNFSFTRLLYYDEHRLGQLLLLAVTGLIVSMGFSDSTVSGLHRQFLLGLLFFFALGLLSAVNAAQPRWAGLDWALNCLLCIALLAVAECRRRLGKPADMWLLFGFSFSIAVYVLGVAAAYLAAILGSAPYNQWLLFHDFSNARFVGQWVTLTLPLLALLPRLLQRPLYRHAAWSLLATWWALLLATGTRGSLFGLAGGAVLSLLAGRRFLSLVKTQVKGLLLGLSGYAVFFLAIPKILWHELPSMGASDNLARAGLSGRSYLWTEATHFVIAHPWLGIGPMQFATHPNPYGAHPHDFILLYASEWGAPAALVLLALLLRIYFTWTSHLRATQNSGFAHQLQIALLWAIGACLTQGLVDGTTVTPYTQTLLIALSGWALGSHLSAKPTDTSRKSLLANRLLRLVAIMTVIYVAIAAMPSFLTVWDRAYIPGEQTPVYVYPRFWADGWI